MLYICNGNIAAQLINFIFMIKFSKLSVELSSMDLMALVSFLDLIVSNYELGDELASCISRFINSVHDAGLVGLPKDFICSSDALDIIGSDGSGKRITL